MVGVDADVLLLGAKGEFATLQCFELVMGLEVRPAPHAAVDNMGQALSVGHLQPAVQRARDGHTLAWKIKVTQHDIMFDVICRR